MFFAPKVIYPIGLDISDLSIKLIQLTKIRDKIKISAVGCARLQPGIIEKGEIIKEDILEKEILKLLASPQYGKVESDEVIACLPETQTFIKLIDVEKKKNLDEPIKEEIEKHIPIPIEELYFDYQVIEEKITEASVLIGAAPKKVVDKFTSLLDKINLSVIALEIEPISICRALLLEEGRKNKGKHEKNYCLLDIGAKRASLTVYSKNSILFSMSLPISGEEITDTIEKKIKLNREQAEKAKIICGLDKEKAEGAVKAILAEHMGKLLSRIKESLDFYLMHYAEYGPIDKIILCGGGGNIRDLPAYLSEELKIDAIVGDPFVNIGGDKEKYGGAFLEKFNIDAKKTKGKEPVRSKSLMQGKELTYTTAIGLGLREVFIDEM
ncbi:MAG: type IV pilus assembly protein PilM [Patescibacteria group bacterium]|jgi:type IV pilus assembly protein PilM